ncbi:hypothetical protein [Thermomonas sp.]|uniref:hypothetical protein n=1 Tax=Thermomonas sp. TaxID=1971895 RepID=UPI001ECA31EE|nr:hypothetical protein [Thermomonas sp.]MBK6415661.1 hypothetical protein [Thermomonas sp.]
MLPSDLWRAGHAVAATVLFVTERPVLSARAVISMMRRTSPRCSKDWSLAVEEQFYAVPDLDHAVLPAGRRKPAAREQCRRAVLLLGHAPGNADLVIRHPVGDRHDCSGCVAAPMGRSSEESREVGGAGIGGFGYVYTVVLCVPFLAQLALRFRKEWDFGRMRWKRRLAHLIIWINFLLASLLMIRAGYTIALILWAFAVLSVVLIRSRRTLPFAISICLVGFLAIGASVFMKPALRGMEVVAANTEYSAKIRDARVLLEEDQTTGTVNDRTERYLLSLKLFIENPVIGTLSYDELGKHSAILDRLGQYGFLFGFMFMALLIHVPIRVMRSSGAPVGLALSFLIVAVGFPMLNPVFVSWGLVLFVFSRGALTVMGISMDHAGRMGKLEQDQRHERTAPSLMRRPR